MSDEQDTQNTESAASEPVETETVDEAAVLKEKIRKMDETIKRNFEDAENWRKHQDSLKSKEEQLAEREAEATKRAESAAKELAIYKAVAKYGLSEQHIDLLDGSDVDAIESKAQKLAALVSESKAHDPYPKADPSQGGQGGGKTSNADKFAAQLEQAGF